MKAKLAWTIVSLWAIAFIAGITALLIYVLITEAIVALITIGVILIILLTIWALIYIMENDL